MLDNGVGEAGLGCMGWAGLGWAGLGQDQVYDKEEFSLPDNNGILPQPSSSVQGAGLPEDTLLLPDAAARKFVIIYHGDTGCWPLALHVSTQDGSRK